MTNLGTLSGGNSSCAFEINSAGVIAGDSSISSGNVNAVSWTNNKIRNLGALPKSIFTAALDLNDNDQVVGESIFSYGPPFQSHAFMWNAARKIQDLGTLSGGIYSVAFGINDSDEVVGYGNMSNNDPHAFL